MIDFKNKNFKFHFITNLSKLFYLIPFCYVPVSLTHTPFSLLNLSKALQPIEFNSQKLFVNCVKNVTSHSEIRIRMKINI